MIDLFFFLFSSYFFFYFILCYHTIKLYNDTTTIYMYAFFFSTVNQPASVRSGYD